MKFLAGLILVCAALGVAALVRTLMIPVRKSDYKPPEGDPRAPAYAEKLSRMVKYDTTSYAGAEQRETFLGYHKILEELDFSGIPQDTRGTVSAGPQAP